MTVPLVVAGLLNAYASLGFAAESVNPRSPVLTIEEAIDVAKRCILERDIRVVGSFIESARYVRSAGARGEPVWIISWAQSREIKGGQVYVSVSQARVCEITFGE